LSQMTPEQNSVISDRTDRLTVRAAAGSGKTRTLVARYLRYIKEDGLTPDQILTITFTRKAAAEMKKKIVSELRDAGLNQQAQSAETGPISTIHGFLERALRENAIAAGIDPEFEIMDEGTHRAMLEDALREELTAEGEGKRYVAEFLRVRAGKREFGQSGALHEAIANDVRSALSKIRGTTVRLSDLRAMYNDHLLLGQLIVKKMRDQGEGKKADQIEAAIEAGPSHKDGGNEIRALAQTCGLMQLALGVWKRLEERMVATQSFDFSELERLAVELIVNHSQTAKRIRGQYQVVLIDEAQDLNPMQYRLLEALNFTSEMLVGDPQQSIYGFRQADYKLFEDRTQVTTTLQLGTNFRTAPKVLQFVDETFQKMWDSKYVAMNPGLGTPGRVEIWKTAPKLWSQFAIWVKEFLTDNPNVNAGDIAVLVRQGSTAAMVQQSLTQAGLQARIAGGSEKFFSRMPIRDLANAMEALSDPESDFALLALLRSPIVSLSLDSIVLLQAAHQEQDVPLRDLLFQFDCPIPEDQTKIGEFLGWFVPIASYADRHAAWEVLSKIMFQSPYLKKVGATANALQSLANIRKLFTMAVQHPDLGPKEFAEKIRRITTLNVKEGDAPAVDDDDHTIQIMTVHKAKGLEFKVVILADLFKPTKPRKSILNALLVDQNTGLVFLKTEIESLSYRWYFEQMAQETVAEEQRVLYVAMTRAQETLIMMVGNSRGESFAKSLAMYAEEQPFVGLIDLTRSANMSEPGDEFATE